MWLFGAASDEAAQASLVEAASAKTKSALDALQQAVQAAEDAKTDLANVQKA